jgi:hypothetical protein
MSLATWAEIVFMEGAVVGVVFGIRSKRLCPASLGGAVLCVGLGLLMPAVAVPLLRFAVHRLAAGDAVTLSLLPVAAATFALVTLGLRALVGSMRPTLRL